MKIRFIGIDPGKDGGISCIDELGRPVGFSCSPRLGEKEFDTTGMAKLLYGYTSDCDFFVVGLEDIHATTVGGNTGSFTMGRGKGIWEGIISMYSLAVPGKFRLILPTPGRWQKGVWEDTYIQYEKKPENKSKTVNTKATSLLVCTHLFQGIDLRKSKLARNPHDGIVDSLLIAEYCRRQYLQESGRN